MIGGLAEGGVELPGKGENDPPEHHGGGRPDVAVAKKLLVVVALDDAIGAARQRDAVKPDVNALAGDEGGSRIRSERTAARSITATLHRLRRGTRHSQRAIWSLPFEELMRQPSRWPSSCQSRSGKWGQYRGGRLDGK